jgi:hypothetical protein
MQSRANGGQAAVRQNTVELAQESQTLASYNFSVEGWSMPRLWLTGLSSGARLDRVTVLHAGIGQMVRWLVRKKALAAVPDSLTLLQHEADASPP